MIYCIPAKCFYSIVGVALGLLLAIMKMTEIRKKHRTVWSVIANTYIDIIRGTPSVLQLLIMYFVVFSSRLGIVAAILSFGINSGAYVAEIIRAGIMAVDKGQMEAGRSLGLSYGTTMRYIIIPQAIKNILPALGNELILLIKETSILGYIAIYDLTKATSYMLTVGLAKFERRLRKNDRN